MRLKPLIHLSGKSKFNIGVRDTLETLARFQLPPATLIHAYFVMTPAEGIARFGFRRWYERELIEGHVYLITCVLSLTLIAACLEQIDWRAPLQQLLFTLCALVLGAALCIGSLRRYGFLLARAECFGAQSSCGKCGVYGILKVIGAGVGDGRPVLDAADNPWVRVQCRKCGHEWRIDNQ